MSGDNITFAPPYLALAVLKMGIAVHETMKRHRILDDTIMATQDAVVELAREYLKRPTTVPEYFVLALCAGFELHATSTLPLE